MWKEKRKRKMHPTMINLFPFNVIAKCELIGVTHRVEVFKPNFIPQILLIWTFPRNPWGKCVFCLIPGPINKAHWLHVALFLIHNIHRYIFLSFSPNAVQSFIINCCFRVWYLGEMMDNIGLEQRWLGNS